MTLKRLLPAILALATLLAPATPAAAQVGAPIQFARPRIKDIATVKGPQDRFLVGMGLVFGLKGTGDGSGVLMSSRYRNFVQQVFSAKQLTLADMQSKNVAIVNLTATLPAYATMGSRMDVRVASAGEAGSILGGTLVASDLWDIKEYVGPDEELRGDRYAWAQGVIVDSGADGLSTAGRIPGGATVTREVEALLDGGGDELYLILNHPDRATAVNVAEAINQELRVQGSLVFDVPPDRPDLAWARDARTVVVEIPDEYQDIEKVVRFVATVETIRVPNVDAPGRVVIDSVSGAVVINGNVMVSEVAITIPGAGAGPLVVQGLNSQGTPLQDLVGALKALNLTPRQLVQILQAIDRAGALQGRLEVM